MNKPLASDSSLRRLGWQPWLLAAVDVLLFLFFAAQGRATHGEDSGAFPLLATLRTALPFALPWFLLAWAAGVYRQDVRARPGAALGRTALAWLAAGPLGLMLRAVLQHEGGIPIVFMAVALAVNLALLGAWHWLCALFLARRG